MKLLLLMGIGGLEILVLIGLPLAIVIFVIASRFFKKKFNSNMDVKIIALSVVVALLVTPIILMIFGAVIGLVASLLF
jgi:hypothetical protein